MGKFIRKGVQSSMITSLSHDDFNDTMEIVFCYGGIYEYSKVSNEMYEKLKDSKSTGDFFNKNIRDKFKHRKVRD
ncbi:MAG: KTSC domain-containing protein [Bacteroidetes bacterium]|nr:MAG: KTSC domain-containing protein [Bacteroidota bacterium]